MFLCPSLKETLMSWMFFVRFQRVFWGYFNMHVQTVQAWLIFDSWCPRDSYSLNLGVFELYFLCSVLDTIKVKQGILLKSWNQNATHFLCYIILHTDVVLKFVFIYFCTVFMGNSSFFESLNWSCLQLGFYYCCKRFHLIKNEAMIFGNKNTTT